MKIIKRLFIVLLTLPILAVLAAVVLIVTIDPNRLKPVLQDAMASQGIDLTIQGDISWQFYPNIGAAFSGVSLGALHNDHSTPLASGDNVSVSVQLMPLLRRDIMVDGIYLNGFNVVYSIDENGRSNWDSILETEDSSNEPAAEPSERPTLAIEHIAVRGLTIEYSDAQTGSAATITDLNFSSENLALDGTPFPVELHLLATYNDLPPAEVAFSGPLGVDLEAQTLILNQGELSLGLNGAQAIAHISTQTHWGEALTSQGHVEVQPFSPLAFLQSLEIELPPMQNPAALHQFGFSTRYDLQPDTLDLAATEIQLDDTRIRGNLSMRGFEQPKIASEWQGTQLNLDDYLPPETDESESAAPPTDPQPLPLEALRNLDLAFSLAFERITVMQVDLAEPKVRLTAADGLLNLEELNAFLSDGSISGQGLLDARNGQATLALDLTTQNVSLGPLLQNFADLDFISGQASAQVEITSRGATDQALLDNLKVEAEAVSEQLQLTPFNLTQQFCRAVALLEQTNAPTHDWPQRTELEPVTLRLQFMDQTLTLNNLSADIARLLASAKGEFDLASGEFDFPFALSLGDFAEGNAEVKGCLPIKEEWRERALPIRCKGNINDIGIGTCLPDTQLITSMLRDRVRSEVQQEVEERREEAEDRLKDKARDLLEDMVGDDKASETENRLRDLLNRARPR